MLFRSQRINNAKQYGKNAGIGVLVGGASVGGVKGFNYVTAPTKKQLQNEIQTVESNLRFAEKSYERAPTEEDREKLLKKVNRIKRNLDRLNYRFDNAK